MLNYSEFDKKYIWHTFTQEAIAPLNINIVKGEGVYLYDENSKKYLDLVSSWWTSCHGHCNKKIAESIYKQSLKLEHLIFANLTHESAINLVNGLRNILDKKLSKFFFPIMVQELLK